MSSYDTSTPICPVGAHNGLEITVKSNDLSLGYDLGKISFKQQVEVVVKVDPTLAMCNSYKDIQLQVVSTCEKPTPNSAVNQYGYAKTSGDDTSDSKPISYLVADKIPNKYMKSACNNFDLNKWKKFINIINDVCKGNHPKINELGGGGKLHPYVDSICTRGNLFENKINNMPGGNTIQHLPGDTQSSMFDFLNKSDSYLTFGSNSPYTISYSSSKTEPLTLSASLTYVEDASGNTGLDTAAVLYVVGVKFATDLGLQYSYAISDTKSDARSHGTENTISVTFADDDLSNLTLYLKKMLF